MVRSTYTDFRDERRVVIQSLMEMDCIPAEMRLFLAADEQHWRFIKKMIDDCDYYVLIIGGRYGSVTGDGIQLYRERVRLRAHGRGQSWHSFTASRINCPLRSLISNPQLVTA